MRALGTGATGGGDMWTNFMKLTEEARVRNSGLTTAAKKITQPQRPKSVVPSMPGLPLTQPQNASRVSFASGKPDIGRRILGGQFDAYA